MARAALVLGRGGGATASSAPGSTALESTAHETGDTEPAETAENAPAAAELTSASWQSPAPEGKLLGPVGRYLYEPDGAVIRAGLVTDLAQRLGAHLVHPDIAYLSSQTLVETPLARAYEVREVLPHTVKVLRRWVREHDVGTLDVKKRGTDVTPEQLRKQLAPRGTLRATLVMTRVAEPGGERRVVLAVNPLH